MPRDGIEREFKAMLEGADERERILALIGGSMNVLVQRNMLFDTPSRWLGKAGLSLRLRHENGHWILTAKGEPRERKDDVPKLLTHRGEAEVAVRPAMAAHLIAGTADPLALLRRAEPAAMALKLADAIEAAAAGAQLRLVGEFRNERTLCAASLPCGTEVSLALDRSEMPDGTVEHELELEIARGAAAPAAAWLEALMQRAEVPLRPARSKRQRFDLAMARRDGAAPARARA
jgi:inorganic triphosphatase YgiF